MSQYVRLEVRRLGELFVATIKRTHIGSIAGVDSNVGSRKNFNQNQRKFERFVEKISLPQIEIQRKAFSATLKRALEWFLARMDQLVTLQFGTFDKRFATFGTNVNAWAMGVQMFAHG
jgi:hypothetical protein